MPSEKYAYGLWGAVLFDIVFFGLFAYSCQICQGFDELNDWRQSRFVLFKWPYYAAHPAEHLSTTSLAARRSAGALI